MMQGPETYATPASPCQYEVIGGPKPVQQRGLYLTAAVGDGAVLDSGRAHLGRCAAGQEIARP